MLPIFEKLKALIERKINIQGNTLINKQTYNINIINNSKEENAIKYIENQDIYSINLAKLNKEEIETIKELCKEQVQNNKLLLEKKSSDLLNELYTFKKTKNSTLEFFHGIIPPNDFIALKASIFIRDKFKTGDQINELKRDIIYRFGDRGKNICNLCSAGYFEGFLMPLYNADMSTEKNIFKKIYDDLISECMLAIFVYFGMEPKDIPHEIEEKIKISKKYGFKFIHIHGIGQKNINTIKKFIENNKNKKLFDVEKIRYSNPQEHILITELILP